MMLPSNLVLAVFGVGVIAVSVTAQTVAPRPATRPRPTPSESRNETAQPSGILAPIAADIAELPPNYPGDSIEEVARLLKAAPKSEFETNEQYNERLRANRSGRTYSFWIDRPMERFYDAETQTLRLSVVDTNCAYIGRDVDCRRPPLIVKIAETRTSATVLRNGFGATRQGLLVENANHGLLLANPPLQFVFQIPLPVTVAKVLKDTISLFITVGPVTQGQQLVFEGTSMKLATFDAPLQTFDKYVYLDLPLIRTWIASRATGQIFEKFDISPF